MNNPKLQQFLESFASEQGKDKMEDLMKLSFEAMGLMQKQFSATSEKEKAEALEALIACSGELNTQFDKLCGDAGMTREEMQNLAEEAKNFTPEQLLALQPPKADQPSRPKLTKSQWIAG